uniref:Uncharacterized protein n=1 Tax=Ditylenchus dipsaci TaxID=166011 RepID=A0A915DAV8_9BILA
MQVLYKMFFFLFILIVLPSHLSPVISTRLWAMVNLLLLLFISLILLYGCFADKKKGVRLPKKKGPNTGKYGSKKVRIQRSYMQGRGHNQTIEQRKYYYR